MLEASAWPAAVNATGLGIRYRRYVKRATTLKEALIARFRGTHYESYWALRDINLTIDRGESIGVIGPNGAGKSTMLKAFASILPPSEGTLTVHGKIAPLLGINSGFRNDLTGRENIFLHGAILGLSYQQLKQRVDGIIAFSGLNDFIDSPLYTYSSGMRARLGFAVATDVDPDILLLDEVLSVGDAEFRTKAMDRIEQFFTGDKTIIFISHSLEQVERLCTRAIYLRAGRILADGSPRDIIEYYMSDVQQQV